MLLSLIIYKLVALYLGVQAVGELGQFISLMSIVVILSTAGISNGITKLVSQYKDSDEQLLKVLKSAILIVSISSISLILILFFGIEFIFNVLFHLENIENWFKYFFIVSIFFISTSQLMISVVNGLKYVKVYALSISMSAIISITLAVPLIQSYELYGALSILLINYIMQSLSLFFFMSKKSFFVRDLFHFEYSKDFLLKYLNYALMFMVSALTVPLVQITIRNMVGDSFGALEIGYWESLMKMSSLYITFISVFLSVYYLPLLAESSDEEMIEKALEFFKKLFFILGVVFIIIYFFKVYIIQILFSSDFLVIADYIYIQQIGDFFKLLSFIFGYIVIVKMWTKIYIVFELFHSVAFVLLGNYFIYNSDGFYGASIAYALTYFLHFLANVLIFLYFMYKVKGK